MIRVEIQDPSSDVTWIIRLKTIETACEMVVNKTGETIPIEQRTLISYLTGLSDDVAKTGRITVTND